MKFTHPFSEYVSEGSLGANEIHVIKEGLKYISHVCPSYTERLKELCIFPHSFLHTTQDVWVPQYVCMHLCSFSLWLIYLYILLLVVSVIRIKYCSLLPSRSTFPNPSPPFCISHCQSGHTQPCVMRTFRNAVPTLSI